MKTPFHTTVKSGLTAIILVASLFSLNASAATITAAAVSVEKGTVPADIKKVIVTGNAKVLLVQSKHEAVRIDEFDQDKVTLKQVGHTLTINSSESSPVTVVVYVKDIYRIDAAGQTTVKTLGKFKVNTLQVMLKDEASARVKADTKSIYTVIDGHANLELLGTTGEHISKIAGAATLDTVKFAALKTNSVNTLAVVTAASAHLQTATLSK